MNRFNCLVIFAAILLGNTELYSQKEIYIVKKVQFSSGINDEFSPVFYNEGLVFCSNQRDNSLIVFKGEESRLFNMFYTVSRGKSSWSQPVLFTKEFKSSVNVGPATFNSSGKIMYFNRNNAIVSGLKNVSDTTNKLGIFSASLVDGIWSGITPFSQNDPLFTFCTPTLSPDGKRIYFSSDLAGGFGGMDLYYCDSLQTGWSKPVNMGPVINTPKNESFPFAALYGKLYFASDGHKGFGGKDIFYTLEINNKWTNPVHLDSALNSPYDDFGLVADSSFSGGYFSSNRFKTDDIFSFSVAPEEFSVCDSLTENNYCFTFFDERQRLIDTTQVIYLWNFGEGIIKTGREVRHCFPGPGEYTVSLSIIDQMTGDTISRGVRYDLKLEEKDQPFIMSPNTGIVEKQLEFEGRFAGLKDFRLAGVFWDFGNGFIPGGEKMEMSFRKDGEYVVKLGLTGEKDSVGNIARRCVMKKIRIYGSSKDAELILPSENRTLNTETAPVSGGEKALKLYEFLMTDLSSGQKNRLRAELVAISNRTIVFTPGGLSPGTDDIFPVIADILKNEKDIRLEIIVHRGGKPEDEATHGWTELLAGELGFRLRLLDVGRDQLSFTGSKSVQSSVSNLVVDDQVGSAGFVELIFMKK